MPLSPGERLGPYEIVAPIGAGGMGEVYKARDTRLGRTVAVKTSNARFSERFEREARAVAALSHPNICTLYDVGPDYLVMEFIDGKPLKGPLPVDVALRYAREIAGALAAAHRLNIVHRDLKPANILVTKSGIKLLDFGLAKMGGPVSTPLAAADQTVTTALTEEGAIIGTLQYMSPEQLEGKETDERSDIFAFGCVLYELLTGRAAFEGESKASIIAAILDREPKPLTGVTPSLASAIQRCMAKDPEDRWQSAADLAGVLDLAASVPVAVAPAAAAGSNAPRLALALLALIAVAGVAAAVWFATRKPVDVKWTGTLLGGPAGALGPRISPDGHTIAFGAMVDGQTQLAVLKPETGNWTVLTHQKDLGQITEIAWSRDGSKLYFDRTTDVPGGVFSLPVLGGEPRMVLESAADPQVLADGSLSVLRINAHRDSQLYRFWPDSGKVEPLPAVPDVRLSGTAARAMPDGKRLVFYGHRSNAAAELLEQGLFIMDADGTNIRKLAPDVIFPPASLANSTQVAVSFTGMADGRSLALSVPSGALYRVLEVPLDGKDTLRTMFTTTLPPWYLDSAPDGAIYLDQIWESQTLLEFPESGGLPKRLTGTFNRRLGSLAVLRDGRVLVQTASGNSRRIMIVEKDGTLSPLVESNESCGPPVALVGDHNVAVATDRSGEIAVVSIADGRMLSRMQFKKSPIDSLATPDEGKTFYFISGGVVWKVASAGGEPVQVTAGDSLVFDPDGRELVIALGDKDSYKLMRLPLAGGVAQPITWTGDLRMSTLSLTAGAVNRDGKIVVATASAAQWAYSVGVVDMRAGTLKAVPHTFDGEVVTPAWGPKGDIVAVGREYNFTMWRFRPSGESHGGGPSMK
jgi:eukaryotic-like serine/threonine-protein kinase